MKILFVFLDGVGLGKDDPENNPFAQVNMPALQNLLGGQRLLAKSAPLETARATLMPLDACLGVKGMPQSATGQAALLTGINVSASLGYHYGPKPNPEIAAIIKNGNIFDRLQKSGKSSIFMNAYPENYFKGIQSGRRLYSAIPLAVTCAGLPLHTTEDLYNGKALSADFTGQGWRSHLGMTDSPILTPHQAGGRMAALAGEYDFSFFEYWLSDYAGHGQDMSAAYGMLTTFDQVLAGLLDAWDDQAGLILLTSDHGNMEDMNTRRHTTNPAPLLLVGDLALRQSFAQNPHDLTDVAPAIFRFLTTKAR